MLKQFGGRLHWCLFTSHALTTRSLDFLSFLYDGAETTTPMTDQILEARSLNPLLITDLASDGHTSPQVQQRDELGECAQEAAIADCFGVLSEDVARAEVGDDAGRAVVETAEDSVAPLARHDVFFFWDTAERHKTLGEIRCD